MNHLQPYQAMGRFSAVARDRTGTGAILIVILSFEALFWFAPGFLVSLLPSDAAVDAYYDGLSPLATIAGFAVFALVGGGLVLAVRKVHGRGLASLLGDPNDTRRDFRRALTAVLLVLAAQVLLPPYEDPSLLTFRPVGQWAIWLFPAVLAIFVQIATEEIFFRGYLQQQLGARFRSPVVWMLVPSLYFGVGHYYNGFGPADGVIYAVWATLLGLACADLTARTGNLGAALGLHLANNLYATTLVSVDGWPGSGLALMLYPYEDPAQFAYGLDELTKLWAVTDILIASLGVLVMWLAARIAVRR